MKGHKSVQQFVDDIRAGKWRRRMCFSEYHWMAQGDVKQRLIAFGLVIAGVQTVEPTTHGTTSMLNPDSLIAYPYATCLQPGHRQSQQLLGGLLSACEFRWSGCAGDTYMQACGHQEERNGGLALPVCAWFYIFKRLYDAGVIDVHKGDYSPAHMIASSDLQCYWPWPVTDLRADWEKQASPS